MKNGKRKEPVKEKSPFSS